MGHFQMKTIKIIVRFGRKDELKLGTLRSRGADEGRSAVKAKTRGSRRNSGATWAGPEHNQGWSYKHKGQSMGSMPMMENPIRVRKAHCPQGTWH